MVLQLGFEGVQMRFVAGRYGERAAFDFGKALASNQARMAALMRLRVSKRGTAFGMGGPPGIPPGRDAEPLTGAILVAPGGGDGFR